MKNLQQAEHIDPAEIPTLGVNAVLNNLDDKLAAAAHDFATHPDFAKARADGVLWDSTSLDGLAKSAH